MLALGASCILIGAAATKPGPEAGARAGTEPAELNTAGEFNTTSEAKSLLTTNLSCANLTNLLLAELHLSPEVLAAVQCSDEQVRSIVGAAKGLCESQAGAFDAAQAQYEDALGKVHRLEHLALTGRITNDQRKELRQSRADLDDARNNREILFHQVRDAIRASLSQDQASKLASITAARHLEVPIEHKLAGKTDAQLLALREQLAQQKYNRQSSPDSAPTPAPETPNPLPDSDGLAIQVRTAAVASLWIDILGK
jgi:hypothetical protein